MTVLHSPPAASMTPGDMFPFVNIAGGCGNPYTATIIDTFPQSTGPTTTATI